MKKIALLLCLVMMTMVLFSCEKKTDAPVVDGIDYVKQIKDKGVLVVGTSADFPPFEFIVMEEGKEKIVGFDMDIAQLIADELGVKLEIKDMNFFELIPTLSKGNVDLVIAGMVPTIERMNQVDFSNEYYSEKHTVLIRVEDVENFTSMTDFDDKILGAQTSTVQEELATSTFTKSKIISEGKITTLTEMLKNREIDGIVMNEVVAKSLDITNESLIISGIDLGSGSGAAVALPKKAENLKETINLVLKRIIENGELEKMVTKASLKVDN